MEKVQWYGVVGTCLAGLLAWDNWQVREELDKLRNAQVSQIAVVSKTPALGNDCPALPTSLPTKLASPVTPAVNGPDSPQSSNTTTVQIPPGVGLLEAIKIIQREQAKTQPGSAAVNPFGASR